MGLSDIADSLAFLESGPCIILDGISGMITFGMDELELASSSGNTNGEVTGACEHFGKQMN